MRNKLTSQTKIHYFTKQRRLDTQKESFPMKTTNPKIVTEDRRIQMTAQVVAVIQRLKGYHKIYTKNRQQKTENRTQTINSTRTKNE